ncbi:alpha-mannosidase [Flavobacterium sp. GA093]|uniref:Alpha-mannosidase n=1 Tax=Flavobacterium hydrocarbonoxydans TaxID=2683249 RepID=A0A6I4NST0_9FLAO|nr:glycoside hydrolase domain-containing protein [Flavobacterium hydrocarbonoxydans]MWB96092.1 alpha-mannosidase [Flavobacterium hydrocarbonoxydans]
MFKKSSSFTVKHLFWCLFLSGFVHAQSPGKFVNVFLGTSGDHGQLSPAASYPFRMMSIGPQTYPGTHTGYEYYAKEFIGFTHNRMEGAGCQGDGGNLLITPFQGNWDSSQKLIKKSQKGSPGYYAVSFENGINAEFTVNKNLGMHHYTFKGDNNGIYVDLSYAFVGRFVDEKHEIIANNLEGFIQSGTTCSRGTYKIFYALEANVPLVWEKIGTHQYLAKFPKGVKDIELRVAFSSIDTAHAKQSILGASFLDLKKNTAEVWDEKLSQIKIEGDTERKKLFYSLLYRTLQSPFVISEEDKTYRSIDGTLNKSENVFYNGWAVWDNYKTQLPLLSLAYPKEYKDIAWSLADLYRHGKQDFSTQNEPSQTVRTEHAVVVLLDAFRKGYDVPLKGILDSLVAENAKLDFSTPDKALESSYDNWALSQIYKETGNTEKADFYTNKALDYKKYWKKDFEDLTQKDVDQMSARKMYQGTIWQYRWLVPYDVKGLKELCGSEEKFINQLDEFFNKDYYNHANETDIQAPGLYFATKEAFKSEALMRKIAIDTVTQFYFNDNSRGIDPYVGRIYQNNPKAFLRTMDDDAGAMSSWFVMAASGITPACVGWPVYYLHVPLFQNVIINEKSNHPLKITVENFTEKAIYLNGISLNGKKLNRNWITQDEIRKGGELKIKASEKPLINANYEGWETSIKEQ